VNAQHEPAYPGADTVVLSIRAPNMVAHSTSERCGLEVPHLISECGEFVAAAQEGTE
jgi:hypothetical protein